MDLFGGPPVPLKVLVGSQDARLNDRVTSHMAAQLPRNEHRVEMLHAYLAGPLIDEAVALRYGWDKGTTAKRRLRLERAGLLRPFVNDQGYQQMSVTSRGAAALLFEITDEGRRWLQEADQP